MKFKTRILETEKEIGQRIGNALIPEVRVYIARVQKRIKEQLPIVIQKVIVASPEYSSIIGGSLKYEFGIPNPSQKLAGLLSVWTNNIRVTFSPPVVISGGTIKSSLTVEMIKSDFSDVLETDYAFVNDQRRGYSLPWLRWLLLDGSYPLVKNHQVMLGSNPRSRTGMAVMVEEPSQSWSVPKRFAGTINDNWITRSLELSKDLINNSIIKAMNNG